MRLSLLAAALFVALFLSLLCGCQIDLHNPYEDETVESKWQTVTVSVITPASDDPLAEPALPSTTTTPISTAPVTETHPTNTTANSDSPVRPPITEPVLPPEPADTDLVLLSDYLPKAILDIRYATTNNFTGQVIYERAEPRLRYGTVQKLRTVCQKLEGMGYRLVIWDAWRPAEAQWKLWNICPDPTYVSNPGNGYSSHTRGGTVDISLVYLDGSTLEMPTDFDDFSKAADTDFSDVSADAARHAQLLQDVMIECGFKPYKAEWWHFTDTVTYDVQESLPE